MIFIIPLLPIAIALFLIVAGVFGEIQSNINTINTILTICVAVVFAGISIYNLTRDYVSMIKKVFSTLSCGIFGFISSFVLKNFLHELASIDMDVLGVIEFGFVGIIGGCIALLVIMGCIWVCCWFGD